MTGPDDTDAIIPSALPPPEPTLLGPLPIAKASRLTPQARAKLRALEEKLKLEANLPVVALANYKPTSLDDARDATARALAEMLLQNKQLKRFRRLLHSKNDKISLAAYELAFERIISVLKPGAGEQKPTQIIVNNLVARPGGGAKKDSTVVEVR